MANLILASKRETKNGNTMWHVYRSENNNKSEEFYFANPLKALRYAFILRKRFNAIIPKGVYGKLMADVKASKPESAPAEVESTAQESAPAEVESTAQESAPAQAESAPKKKGARKSAPRKRTAKKANTEPNTESK